MSHQRFCIFFFIIFVFTVQLSYAAKGNVGSIAQLDSDDIKLKHDGPIRKIYVIFESEEETDDLDILKFIQALQIRLHVKKFGIANSAKKADVVVTLNIQKIKKDYWLGLPTNFGNQRQIQCLSVETTYETSLGKWAKEFIAHKGYWTFKGDAYFRDTTDTDLARAIVNPLHDYPKEKAFIKAAGGGDLDAVRIYIDGEIFVDADNDEGDTAIIAASRNKHVAVIQFLIDSDADVNARNNEGWSSLTFAAFNGDARTTLLLLNNGARVNNQDRDSLSPLDWAVKGSNKFIVTLLLSHGANADNALILAKRKGDREMVKLLKTHIEEERRTTEYDCSYLSRLIRDEREERIQQILESGLVAIEPGNRSCVHALMIAAQKGNTQIIKDFLAKGFDADEQDAGGETPLTAAAAAGHKEAVEALVANGADLNYFGSSALVSAVTNGHKEVVEYLLTQVANINAQGQSGDTKGVTPLSEAARTGRTEMVDLLLSKGANINARNSDGKTALMAAALEGRTAIVESLLSGGANIDQRDRDGRTAMDLVAQTRIHATTINYRDVYYMLKKEERKRSDKYRTLKSRKLITY